jgi:hypothetical protein
VQNYLAVNVDRLCRSWDFASFAPDLEQKTKVIMPILVYFCYCDTASEVGEYSGFAAEKGSQICAGVVKKRSLTRFSAVSAEFAHQVHRPNHCFW